MKTLLIQFALAYADILKIEDVTEFEILIADGKLIVASFKAPDHVLVCGEAIHYETTHWIKDEELYAEYRLILTC